MKPIEFRGLRVDRLRANHDVLVEALEKIVDECSEFPCIEGGYLARKTAKQALAKVKETNCKQLEYREQIERLESDLSGAQLAIADYSAENIQLRKDIDQMEERLFKYGRCLPDCTGKYTGGNCDCGWETILSEGRNE